MHDGPDPPPVPLDPSLTRPSPRERRRRRLIGLGIVAGAVALAALTAVLAGGKDREAPQDQAREARSAAGQVLDVLALIDIEYEQAAQSRSGTPEAHETATADLARARKVIATHADAIDAIDGGAAADIDAGLAAIARRIAENAQISELRAAVARVSRRVSALLDAAASP